jgi:hypothetical protein
LGNCATGKNAFDKGDFETALSRAVNRLKSNPNSKKAREVLTEGYEYATQYHLAKIKDYSRSSDAFKWERIYTEYVILNRYYRDIIGCPACMDAITPVSYIDKQDEAAFEAATVQVNFGKEALSINTVETGRQAYSHFQTAMRFAQNYPDIDSLLNVALDMGTLKVLVQPIPTHSRALQISNEYFNNRMYEYLNNYSRGKFLRFITGNEAVNFQIQPDHVISMIFDDFVLGSQLVEKEIRTVERDSVKVGTYKDDEGINHDVLGTVKAELTVFKKTLATEGVLNFEIRDAYSNTVLVNRKFSNDHIWFYEWASFNGDERALNEEQRKMVERKEIPPPSPQELFAGFIDRIYDQATSQLVQTYRGNNM